MNSHLVTLKYSIDTLRIHTEGAASLTVMMPSMRFALFIAYTVYATMWFTVKYQKLAANGSQNMYFLMQWAELMEYRTAVCSTKRFLSQS